MQTEERFPPGTQRIEDNQGDHVVLAPQPPADPNHPLNWSKLRKGVHMTLLSLYTLLVFAILCVSVPLWQKLNEELGMSYEDLNNGYATNMATLALGCIFFVPLAHRYGRRPVYIVTALVMFGCAIWQARQQTVGDMIGVNALSGLAGAVNEALFQVTVCDLFFVHQRGTLNGLYMAAVYTGNYLGPVAAGYVAVSQPWRWVFWYCTIFMGIVSLAMVFALEESKYIPVTVGVRPVVTEHTNIGADNTPDDKSKSPTGDLLTEISSTATAADDKRIRLVPIDTTIPTNSYWKRHAFITKSDSIHLTAHDIYRHVIQPFQILITFPAVMFTALQYGFLIAMLGVLAVTQASLYALPPYNFSTAGIGNMNIPPAVGAILGAAFGGPLNDLFILGVAKRRKGIYEPETRLWLFMVPGVCMPLGLLLYGLTISKGMHWAYNAVGAGFIGAAIGGCGDISLTYCQDCYQDIIGDALTSVVFVRNAISTALVFAVTPWMTGMGVFNMFIMLGCLGLAVALTCVPLIIWGRRWRIRLAGRYEYFAMRQLA
ncbi:putative MFS-type transporter [Cyphellophora attinorum]|uniref:Putative MFS-type transporter n=1 Tax=Cyphellophora attinorum TaxID=1664694 RepID=A0A0N1P0F8_9EURO|nr:putative MFS-type transporter [Phialophora attinorum]KPI39025.1 putative MFS-type transporter [Phialophora attinorum]